MCLQHGCHPAALTVSSLKHSLPNVFFLTDDPSIQLARQQYTVFVVYATPHLTLSSNTEVFDSISAGGTSSPLTYAEQEANVCFMKTPLLPFVNYLPSAGKSTSFFHSVLIQIDSKMQ